MKLTPLDIHHKEFRNALRGYSPEEVDDFLDEVADEFERLFKENIDLNEKLDAASARVREYGALEHTLQATLVSAQTSAEDIKSRAAAEADRMVREAEAKAAEIIGTALNDKQHSQAETVRLQKAENEFRASFKRMLESYLKDVADVVAPAPVAAAVVAAPEPVEPVSVVEPKAASKAAPKADPEPVASEGTGAVMSLTLGEVGESTPSFEDEMPSLEIPEEFALPPRGPVGELDDLDIEEID
jgi:cell division initiation protein